MSEMSEEEWNEETYRVYQSMPMLSWEACEMIAYNNLTKKINNENFNRQVSQEG